MNFYFVANNVTQEAKKKAILLTEMGGNAYQVIRNLLVPSTPGETTFNQIVTLMQEPEEVGQLSREFLDQSNRAIFYASWLRFLSRKFTQDGKNLEEHSEIFIYLYKIGIVDVVL